MNQNQSSVNILHFDSSSKNESSHFSKIKKQRELPHYQYSVDKIMDFFNIRYRNILPNRLTSNYDFKNVLFPFGKAQVVEILYQMEIFIQLLVQNFLFATKQEIKCKSYELLMKICYQKQFVESFLEQMPTYHISLSKIVNSPFNQAKITYNNSSNVSSIYLNLKPQMSILQSPLLEFTEQFIDIKNKCNSKEKSLKALLSLEPLIQRDWLPIFSETSLGHSSVRNKFNQIDDRLLLIGLVKYGPKRLELIQQNFLYDKKVSEIKNRYKNLICSRAADNKIKRWKILQFLPLRDTEKKNLEKAIEWFGCSEKFHLITRYFLIDRSPEYLQAELSQSENLEKKRKKYANLMTIDMNIDSPQVFECQDKRFRSTTEVLHSVSKDLDNDFVEFSKNENTILNNDIFSFLDLGFPNQNPNQMIIEAEEELVENQGKSLGNNSRFLRETKGNFEAEEMEFSHFSEEALEETMPDISQTFEMDGMTGRKFKKINSIIFEYEEI